MKRKYLRAGIYCCFVLLLLLFVKTVRLSFEVENYQEKFTFVAPLAWNRVAGGVDQADKEFGTNTKLVGFEELSEEGQVQEIEHAIATKVDGIITAAVFNSQRLRTVIKEAEDAGIPVVLLDSDMEQSERSAYVGTDNYAAGSAAGKDIIEAVDGSAKIGVVVSECSAPNQAQRLAGLQEALQKEPGMEIVEVLECHSNYLELAEKIPRLLREHQEIGALCFLEGRAGSAMGYMLQHQFEERNLSIVAFDIGLPVLRYVADGTYYSTIMQEQHQEGYLAVETLCRICRGETWEADQSLGVTSIRAEDCQELIEKGESEFEWHYS